jgi:hypothetical protein
MKKAVNKNVVTSATYWNMKANCMLAETLSMPSRIVWAWGSH